jgi:integrase/recombinase XerD
MLTELFPKAHGRFLPLPVLGGVVDGFAQWLFEKGYSRSSVRQYVRCSPRLDRALRRRGCPHLTDVTPDVLSACVTAHVRKDDPKLAAAVGRWHRYLHERGLLAAPLEPSSPSRTLLAAYGNYLRGVRGFTVPTVTAHLRSVAELLRQLDYDASTARMTALSSRDIEEFLQVVGRRQARATLQHAVAHLRGFLRFLAAQGELRPGLDAEIDTPRVYRLEQLPRALPWDTVQTFLRSIDRRTPTGRRDYAIFLLVATYGLRAHEVAALTLDAIEWRAGTIRIFPRKGGHPLLLPLTDEVGAALADYLRYGRPSLACRDVFLRCRAPAGAIKRTAVTDAFQAWSRRSGLSISFQGPHCLRHSYAVHLLRQGVPLKTIGDVLGHRSPEATRVYLRLSTDDLRNVALPLPREDAAVRPPEVEP